MAKFTQTLKKFFELFERLERAFYPDEVCDDENFKRLLFAVQYVERFSVKTLKNGRPSRFDEIVLLAGALKLKSVLQYETVWRISLLRFVLTYFLILNYLVIFGRCLTDFKLILKKRGFSHVNHQSL